MALLLTLVLTLTSGLASGLAAAREAPAMDPNARDLRILTAWFAGEFDNEEQRWFHSRSGRGGEPVHVRIHATHRRIDAPALGEHVFYIQHHLHDDPADISRQRVAVFVSEPEDQSIRMKQGFFKDRNRALDAHIDPGRLAGLSEDEVFFLDGCDVFWRRVADQYVANMQPKACVLGDGELRRYAVHRWTLSHSKLWLVDSSFLLADDSLYIGLPVDQPFRMRRARLFECEVTFLDDDRRPVRSIRNIRMHSQGGLVWFDPDENGDVYGIRMRDKEYPFYSERPDFLLLSLQKQGQDNMVGYAVTDVDARRVGFNLGWTMGHCHREGYEFREPLELLEH